MSSFRYGSHLPVLMQVVKLTDKPIIEFGSGIYSSVFLHWSCFHNKRKLVTVENNKTYWRSVKNLNCFWHSVNFVKSHDDFDVSGDWGVVLIDHAPGKRRGVDAIKFIDADYVVLHDCQEKGYNYDKAIPHFKYKFEYNPPENFTPSTMVLSNKHDLVGLMDK